jgi:hypothetical protein
MKQLHVVGRARQHACTVVLCAWFQGVIETTSRTPEVDMRKFLVLGCLIAALLIRPAVAVADSLTYAGLGSGAWVNLNLGGVTETGWAGEIKWTLSAGGVSSAITTYCGDLFDDAKIPVQLGTFETTVAVDLNPSISHGAVAYAGSNAAYLVNTNGSSAHASGIQAAGLQIAIWRAMFGDTFTVLNSTAHYSEIMTAAAGYTVPTGVSSVAGYFDVANGANIGSLAYGQDQVLIDTPEPATILLVMFAFIGTLGCHNQLRQRAV